MVIANVLAERYASPEMRAIFDQRNRVIEERRFWVGVMRAQQSLGLDITAEAIADYERVIEDVDLDSIQERERRIKHDVKARLDEFSELAGRQDAHKGLTSRDLTENVEQLMAWRALTLVEARTVALLAALAEVAHRHAAAVIVGRTHNVPAQPTTIGKRLAQAGEELLIAHENLQNLRERYAVRGIKGPVGSQQDQLDLLGSVEKVEELESRIADYLGVPAVLGSVGQVYPRSIDFEVVGNLLQLGSGPANLALSIRLMAGQELVTEGFKPGQVGSSAMPHKMNTRSCERINGLFTILRGHVTMASSLAGDQWNEGDVSCSVVRRVVMPDSFFTVDGLFETTFAVLRDFGVFPEVIQAELERYLPFLATTKLLMHAVQQGTGRETAHELVKEHAVATALDMRAGRGGGDRLLERLADDERFPGGRDELQRLVESPEGLLGTVEAQVEHFCRRVGSLVADRGEQAGYRGADIV